MPVEGFLGFNLLFGAAVPGFGLFGSLFGGEKKPQKVTFSVETAPGVFRLVTVETFDVGSLPLSPERDVEVGTSRSQTPLGLVPFRRLPSDAVLFAGPGAPPGGGYAFVDPTGGEAIEDPLGELGGEIQDALSHLLFGGLEEDVRTGRYRFAGTTLDLLMWALGVGAIGRTFSWGVAGVGKVLSFSRSGRGVLKLGKGFALEGKLKVPAGPEGAALEQASSEPVRASLNLRGEPVMHFGFAVRPPLRGPHFDVNGFHIYSLQLFDMKRLGGEFFFPTVPIMQHLLFGPRSWEPQ